MGTRVFLLAAALMTIGFAGCIEGETLETREAKAKRLGVEQAARDLIDQLHYMVYDATGNKVTPPPELADPIKIGIQLMGKRGAEPNVGVTKNGWVFLTASHSTMRSKDHGATWQETYNHTKAYEAIPEALRPQTNQFTRSSDPMLWVDPITDRVFTDHMMGLYCSNMAYSDDKGDTWQVRPAACGIPVNDHQKWATAGWSKKLAASPPSPAYQSVVYYCYNKLVATNCAVSYNGGLLFQHDQPIVSRVKGDPCGGINGHPAPGPDGTVFVPLNLGCNRPVVAFSEDNGITWQVRSGPNTFGGVEIDPDITVTPDGTAYMSYRGSDQFQYLVRSKDKFTTWEGPFKVSPPQVTATVFTGITSQENGRIAISYLGTPDPMEAVQNKNPARAPNGTRWNLYVTYSLNAADKDPIFATTQANPDEDPVQRGCVWLSGGSNPCRNMLDFIDMASDKEGRIFVAFTDGCTTTAKFGPCAYNMTARDETSRSRDAAAAFTLCGPSLVASVGRLCAEAGAKN